MFGSLWRLAVPIIMLAFTGCVQQPTPTPTPAATPLPPVELIRTPGGSATASATWSRRRVRR